MDAARICRSARSSPRRFRIGNSRSHVRFHHCAASVLKLLFMWKAERGSVTKSTAFSKQDFSAKSIGFRGGAWPRAHVLSPFRPSSRVCTRFRALANSLALLVCLSREMFHLTLIRLLPALLCLHLERKVLKYNVHWHLLLSDESLLNGCL